MNIIDFALSDCGQLFASSIPTGFVIGCFPMIIGAVIHGLINIFKKA